MDRCEDCPRSNCPHCGRHFCCEPCDCGKSHNCPCDCAEWDRRMTYAD